MRKTCPTFNTAAQNWNLSSLSRESATLPLSHCTLQGTRRIVTDRPWRLKHRAHLLDKGRRGVTHPAGVLGRVLHDRLVHVILVVPVEGKISDHHQENGDAERPPVHRTVVRRPIYDLQQS